MMGVDDDAAATAVDWAPPPPTSSSFLEKPVQIQLHTRLIDIRLVRKGLRKLKERPNFLIGLNTKCKSVVRILFSISGARTFSI